MAVVFALKMSTETKICILVAIVALSIVALSASVYTNAFAEPQNGWGKATKDLAHSGTGEVGKHASDPDPTTPGHDTPRSGIGNVAKSFDTKPSGLPCHLQGTC